jgi:parafibromin
MKTPNSARNPPRRTSADSPHPCNILEPEPSFFLRRRKTNKSIQRDDSEPVSPRFNPRPTRYSGGSNKSNLEVKTNSATSSLSLGSKYPQNVSDWNEKVRRESHLGSGEFQPRHAVDPPRPAKEGHEWVWFPEGYWA